MNYMPPVTAHAVLRYLTRVENFDLRPIVKQLGRDAGNWAIAKAAAEQLGMQVIDLQKRICPEHLAGAVRGGAARIRRQGLVLHCAGGVVTTITDEVQGKKVKMLSQREIKAGMQRYDRRCR